MRLGALMIFVSFLILAGCERGDSAHRDDRRSPGESAGQAAYEVQKDAKKAAKELGDDLKTFRHDAREGYKDAQEKDRARRQHEPEKTGRQP